MERRRPIGLVAGGRGWLGGSSLDTYVVNTGFDEGCQGVLEGGGLMSRLENGRGSELSARLGVALAVFAIFLIWGCKG